MNPDTIEDFDLLISPPETMRQSFSTAKKWADYAKEYYNLNWHEQYDIRHQELKQIWTEYKQKRIKNCSTHCMEVIENPLDGDSMYRLPRCGEAECDFCGPYEMAQARENLKQAIASNSGELKRIIVETDSDRAKAMRKYGKNLASFTAIEIDGKVVFEGLIATKDDIGESYTADDLERDNMTKWVKTVYGHNKSGALHTKPIKVSPKLDEDVPTDDGAEIVTEKWTVDFNKSNAKTGLNLTNEDWAGFAINKSIMLTSDLRPTDLTDLKDALRKRREARRLVIESVGGVIFDVQYRKKRIELNDMDWSVSDDRVKKLEREGYFAQIRPSIPTIHL